MLIEKYNSDNELPNQAKSPLMYKTICSLLLLTFANFSHAKSLIVALPVEGNPPYSFGSDQKNKGIYVEIINAIFKHTTYTIEYKYLSPARIRTEFKQNKIDIECCPLSSWREGEQNISTYSDIVFTTNDMLVFPSGENKYFASLANKTVGTISGYGYRDDKLFNRVDMPSERSLLKLVAHNKIPVAIVDQMIAKHWQKTDNLTLDVGQVYEQAARPLRIHQSQAHILTTVNKAIKKLKQQGYIKQVMEKYYRGN